MNGSSIYCIYIPMVLLIVVGHSKASAFFVGSSLLMTLISAMIIDCNRLSLYVYTLPSIKIMATIVTIFP